MNILVTGGAGYIGSHAVRQLRRAGHEVVVIDNLHRGHRSAVPSDVVLEELDIRQTELVRKVLERHAIDGVMHFAALALVGESMQQPLLYYRNNTGGSACLLAAMDQAGVKRMVFSSTAAVYGQPATMPITEQAPTCPVNPYGRSKLFVERMLQDHANARKDFAFAALRYFNVAGCAADKSLGEDHHPETHLIPVMLNAALGKLEKLTIYGEDYPTPDSTCIRDYIHVEDLVAAHITVMESLQDGQQRTYNLGVGKGLSVRELVGAAKRVTGVDFPIEVGPRRMGDPPQLYADPTLIRKELGWEAKVTDIDQIVASAWRWFRENPKGYGESKK